MCIMPSFSMCLTLIKIVKYHMVTPIYFEGPNDTISGEEKIIHPMVTHVQEGPL